MFLGVELFKTSRIICSQFKRNFIVYRFYILFSSTEYTLILKAEIPHMEPQVELFIQLSAETPQRICFQF